MAHKVLVMSPLHNAGATVFSILLAQSASYIGRKSMLTFTDPHSNLPDYVGLQDIDDPTRAVSQVVRLIDSGSLQGKDILTYAYEYAKGCYIMDVSDDTLDKTGLTQIVRYVYTKTPTDVSIVDYSDDILETDETILFEETDQIFLVIQPTKKYFDRLKIWREHKILKKFENVYVVINNYNEVVAPVRQLAKMIGMPGNKVCQLHYNPWINVCTLKKQLHTLIPNAWEMDPRVCNLKQDLIEANQSISGCMALHDKRL